MLLEKRQRKFDAELGLLQEERKSEAAAREKLQKEIDSLKSVKFQLDEQIQVSDLYFHRTALVAGNGAARVFRDWRFFVDVIP